VTAPYGVLVNLGADVPQGFEKFDRLIEVVSTDAADREQARNRWRLYTGQGYAIIRHDLNLKRAD
jgi:DNA polymerase-3 subunit chi